MKRNLLIVCCLLGLAALFLLMFTNLRTNAQTNQRPVSNKVNSNQKTAGNMNKSTNQHPGNAFISNTGEPIVYPKANGTDITTLEDVGVSMIFPKDFEIFDVALMNPDEQNDPDRLFNTRANLIYFDTGGVTELNIYTSHNLSFEESVKNTRRLIIGERGYKLLKRGVKSNLNGFEVVSSSGLIESVEWTIDAIKIPSGALVVVASGFPKYMKRSKAKINSLLQSIKLK